MKTAAIILNTPDTIAEVTEGAVICADGGYKQLSGQTPLAIIGDFDSLGDISTTAKKIPYPVEKNETDGQLCVDYAKSTGFDSIVIYGALGGKIEHVLGNIGLLVRALDSGLTAIIKEPDLTIELITGTFTREVEIGCKISFYPLDGNVLVRHSRGLYYPLENLLLTSDCGRGLSNVASDKKIGLDFAEGRLLYIRYLK